MNRNTVTAVCLGILLLGIRARRAKKARTSTDWKKAWEQEAELLGLPKSAPAGPCGPALDDQGQPIVLTPHGPASLYPGESPSDLSVLERAKDAQEIRRVNAFYEAISQEREKRIPPGSGLKRDRWGFLFEKNPNGMGWREFGSDPDEPYEMRINGSW
jgi:hypothetical protein